MGETFTKYQCHRSFYGSGLAKVSADVPCLQEIFDLDFRTVCGCFVSVFMVFMSKRAMAAKRNRYNILKLKSMLHGATCGLLLSVLFWDSNLIATTVWGC